MCVSLSSPGEPAVLFLATYVGGDAEIAWMWLFIDNRLTHIQWDDDDDDDDNHGLVGTWWVRQKNNILWGFVQLGVVQLGLLVQMGFVQMGLV